MAVSHVPLFRSSIGDTLGSRRGYASSSGERVAGLVRGASRSPPRLHAIRFARAHGIDLVLDRHKLGNLILVAAAEADITTAFIKSYNATSKPRSGGR